ncbi:hypothetical protein DYBT9275_01437 [Dyadobacter sp. CECT 9275]|uniref:RNA polymerase sigma-70 region 2 domain-containing protein n=1 Tax=Dyadobacter helix TaxID=2822344 RepID=A0A916N518_9BACT|nr:sigma factor [Dyadobacter sp. CECT 9275]CAG4994647.1 hypothetical protein DYBT9275_01437 [Dyadobacter sp. CECT 9275]
MNKSLFSEKELLRQLAADNTAAFKILFDQNYPSLVRVMMRYSKDQDEIQLWMKDIYIQLWKSREFFKSERVENFRAYSIMVARNYAVKMSLKSRKLGWGEGNAAKDSESFTAVQQIRYYKAVQETSVQQASLPIHLAGKITADLFTSLKAFESQFVRIISLLRQERVVFRR